MNHSYRYEVFLCSSLVYVIDSHRSILITSIYILIIIHSYCFLYSRNNHLVDNNNNNNKKNYL